MKITREVFETAVEKNILSSSQAKRLVEYLQGQPQAGPVFDLTHVLYYLGGLIAIGAMTLFMNLGWESFGGLGILLVSMIYAVFAIFLCNRFQERGYAIPAGICAAFVVALTPLAIYGLQQALGMWPDQTVYQAYHRLIRWHFLYMELGTLAVGAVMAWRYKYPFLMMPLAVTGWYLSMDVAAMLSGGELTWELRELVSLYSGLLMIGMAFWVDMRSRARADYAFWLYLFGVIAFWTGLTLQHSDSEFSRLMYCGINLVMIGVGVVLVRRVFVIFGAFGVSGYLGHLAEHVFRDSWLFPIALTGIGFLVIFLGILWKKNEQTLTAKVHRYLPLALREHLARR
ncbi:MAG: DUF2157 domain-containing protein [Gammaproteobacteria bacterium]|nr:MAG: DUF2157 domain-containing protein [Gammaproteobacteria bacterium]